MDQDLKKRFTELWQRYLPGAELPIGFYYTDKPAGIEKAQKSGKGHRCLIGDLIKVRKGKSLAFDKETIGCQGGVRYLGFQQDQSEHFGHFLSYGIPGEMEGIRYKKNPQLANATQDQHPAFVAPEEFIIFKHWREFTQEEKPDAVIFFASGDVISALFSLANFDESDPHAVIAPSCAGCASIVQYPFNEEKNSNPKCILGMFDISARPFVDKNLLTFAVPWKKFESITANMEESFLITSSWSRLQKRLQSL